MLTFGSLFAGIGGFDLGFERAGMQCKWQVEIDPFCQKVLRKNFPTAKLFDDVRTVSEHNLEYVDVICGGFPCQDISGANKHGKGIEGGLRSGLWKEYARLIGEIKPRWIVAENVTRLLSINNGRDFGRILRDLDALGYDAEWDVVSAAKFGRPHERERVFLVAYPTGKRLDGSQIFPCVNPKSDTERLADKTTIHFDAFEHTYVSVPQHLRVDNGLPFGVAEVRGFGNAVVPQIAEWIGNRIVAIDNQNEKA